MIIWNINTNKMIKSYNIKGDVRAAIFFNLQFIITGTNFLNIYKLDNKSPMEYDLKLI